MLENRRPSGSSVPQRDRRTVDAESRELLEVPEGASVREIRTHTDDRGTVFEIYDLRWGWHPGPLVYSYVFTIRPGVIKGWAVHEAHEDRYAILFGELEVVLYDGREDSATSGQVFKVVLSEHNRRLLSIPVGVWHADHNIGSKDIVAVNFPTQPYHHAAPDKLRLPLDTPEIPYSFETGTGW